MNPVTTAVVVGAVVVAGRWSMGKAPTVQHGVGIAGIALILSLIEQADVKLASLFGWLILLGVSFAYFPAIVKATGLNK